MSGFTEAWLELREPADLAARNPALLGDLVDWAEGRRAIRIVDLGSGTGANFRVLAPRLGADQDWLLVDRDDRLLDRLGPATRRWAESRRFRLRRSAEALTLSDGVRSCTVRTAALDLASELSRLGLDGVDLVTASALMDLVSTRWASELVRRCRRSGAAVYLALSYDGRFACTPGDPDDERVRLLVNRHQRGDKGFGPALGPRATGVFAELFARAGYRVETAPSDWRLGSDDAALQGVLLDGWLGAAGELDPAAPGRLTAWAARRRALITDHGATLEVGHLDLFARP